MTNARARCYAVAMAIAVGVLALLLVSLWIARANARFERAKRARGGDDEDDDTLATADARVATAWDEFGLAEDAAQARAAVDAVLADAPVAALRRKSSLVALAVMAARAERYDVLAPIATRAGGLDAGCGETAALGVLAAAYAGDRERARMLLARSQAAMAGCASCGAGADTKILMREVDIALAALEEGALVPDEAPHGTLTVSR